jgi:hypothetical protein
MSRLHASTQPSSLADALTLATIPARTASGNRSQNSMTDVRPGSLGKKLAALLVARGGRCWSLFVVFRRNSVVACTVGDGRVRTGKQGFSSPAVVSSRLLTLEAPPGFEPGMKVLQTSGQDDVNPDDAKTSQAYT